MPAKKDVPTLEEALDVSSDKDHVHTWEENHDQNLGNLHPDIAADREREAKNAKLHLDAKPEYKPTEHAQTTRVVTETVYADEDKDNDDKGRSV